MLLKDLHKEQLNTNGYTVLDFLSYDELQLMLKEWSKITPKIEFENYSSVRAGDTEFNGKINTIIKKTIGEKLLDFSEQFHPIESGAIIIKGKNKPNYYIEPHMDPSLVDENQYNSYNIWIPLEDVDTSNGCLFLYDKYEKIKDRIVIRPMNQIYQNITEYLNIDFWSNSKAIELKAGQALIFDHRLPHASKGNSTSIDRIAISTGLIPKNAQIVIYHQTEEMFNKNKISRYKVDYETLSAIASNSFDFTKLSFEVIRQFSWFDFFEIQVKRFYYSFKNKLSKINI